MAIFAAISTDGIASLSHTKHLHSSDGGSTFLQGVSYAYNERGWLRTSGTNGNLFNMELKYNTATTPQYNGNIGQMNYLTTRVANPGNRTFNYTYDVLNRLTNAAFTGGQTGDALDEAISYDVMGNITQLVRNGTGAGTLNYTSYTGNQLNTVTGYSARSYTYDANGNATSDGMGKGITYNLLNLPQTVTSGASTVATYTYEASGNKLRNTGSDGTWDYVNGIVYHNNAIAFINTEEGRAALNSGVYNYEYNLKDHLGNNRVSIDQYGGTARVIQEDEYYSFGLRKPTGGYDLSNNNRYLYNGKEIQTDLTDQYDYGARFYDPVIGRWTSVDPKAELDRRSTSYGYAFDDPMRFTDPDGMFPWPTVKDILTTANDIIGGAVNAYASDVTNTNAPTSNHMSAAAYNLGRKIGHGAAMFTGGIEMIQGGDAAIIGVAAAPETGGLSLSVSAVGVGVAVHGAISTKNGFVHLMSG